MDSLGGTVSLVCLIHCLGLPMLIALAPSFGDVLAVPESVHLLMLALALPVSLLALLRGSAQQCRGWPLVGGTIGLLLMAAGLLAPAWETPLTVGGSLMVVAAHIGNWRIRRRDCGV